MKKVIATTIGVLLATATLSAFAAKEDRENLAQCKAELQSYYGEGTRSRLRNIRKVSGDTRLRLTVKPAAGQSTVVLCWVSKDGTSNLTNSEGVALLPQGAEQKVSAIQ